MMNLTTTTALLKAITTAANVDLQVHASWVDYDSPSTFTPGVTQSLIVAGAPTTTTIVGSPTGTKVRNIKDVNMRNNHASTSCVVEIQLTDGTTFVSMFKVTLAAGEVLAMNAEGVWFVYDVNGGVKVGASAASDTAAGIIALATQSDMETATSIITTVTPGRLKYHPGVAKAVMFTTGTATPVASTPPTYNCTLTDTGVGQLTVNFTVAFSSATAYCVVVNVEPISTTLTAIANVMRGYMRFGGMSGAGTCQVNCADWSATTNVIRDPISWHVVAYGDQ
jgi:hypothetical protein